MSYVSRPHLKPPDSTFSAASNRAPPGIATASTSCSHCPSVPTGMVMMLTCRAGHAQPHVSSASPPAKLGEGAH
eukprot:5206601-Prymnesium_polylepis.2